MLIAYTNPDAYTPGFCPQEYALLERKYYATKVEGSDPVNHVQSLVVTFGVALDLDMSQEAPKLLAKVLSPEPEPTPLQLA
jgi:hypothetical protein